MEVPVVGSDHVKWTHLKVPAQVPPSEPLLSPSPDQAGTVNYHFPSHCSTIWRTLKSSPSNLEIFELGDNEAVMSGLQLAFEEPLSPYIAVYPYQVQMSHEEETIIVCVVTISAVVYIIKIRNVHKHRKALAIASSDGLQFSLSNELARLDQLTCFAGLGGLVCVGGKSGSVLCFPFENISGEVKDHCFELKDSDAILGRLWGLVARTKNAGPVQCLSLQLHKERPLLFALHEDGMFRLWDLGVRSRLLNFNLHFAGYTPKMMWVQEQDLKIGSRQIAILLQKEGVTAGDTLHIYDLQVDQLDGASGQATSILQLQVAGLQGSVLDLKLLSDRFWKLEEVNGQLKLQCYRTKREEVLQSCELAEAEVEDQLFQKPDDNWDDLMLFHQSINSIAKTELRFPVSELFLSRILQPGIYQQSVLRKVLEQFKRRVPKLEFSTFTREQVRKEILSAIEAENMGENKLEHLLTWKAFCSGYLTSWKQSNRPCAIMLDHRIGKLGLVRQQSVSLSRSLSEFEKLVKVEAETQNDGKFLELLHKCMSTMVEQLGRVPVSAFDQVILGNKHTSLSHLSSVYLLLLEVGYDYTTLMDGATQLGVDLGRKKVLDHRKRHRKLELQLMLELQNLREFAGSWGSVLDHIEAYVDLLMKDTQCAASKEPSEGVEYGITSKRLVVKSMAQLSWTHFGAARDLLFLLGYILKIKGQVGISTKEVLRIQVDLMVRIKKVIFLSLLVHWLSVSFAELAPPEDFSLHLSTLRLDSVSAGSTHTSQQMGAQEMTLAEVLVSACSEHLSKTLFSRSIGICNSNNLLLATKAFVSWLMWGESSDHIESLSSRSVTLAVILLQHGQYKALENFLQIVDDICNELEVYGSQSSRGDWCARLHLMGCGLLGQTSNSSKGAAQKRLQKAIHCFFRVASVMGQDRQDLQALLLRTGMEVNFPAYGDISSWKFHYYEWVMQMFEHNNEIDGACQFAHAALQEVDQTINGNGTVVANQDLPNAVPAIKGRLWANIFKFSLDKRKYKEAYCAIISNPDNESKYICLRRFLIVLCEQKAAEVLCGSELPYVEMLERVEQELLLKAHYSDITANPNPFKLLYSFHMQRNNWRRAALYMYLFSIRLKEAGHAESGLSASGVLTERLNSLVAAMNALHLVEPMYAWLDLDSDVFGCQSHMPSSKRIRVYASNDAGYLAQRSKRTHVDLGELDKDYTLTLAQLRLMEAGVHLNFHGDDDSSPARVLVLLVQSGLYDMAFTVLFKLWKDSSLKSELEHIFRIMAETWCMRQQDTTAGKPSTRLLIEPERKLLLLPSPESDVPLETTNSSLSLVTKDTMSSASCNTLQNCLEKYVTLHPQIAVVVAETMLSIDRLMELPFWLVDILKGGRHAGGEGMSSPGANPSALLRIYLDFGRVGDAAMLFLEYAKAWSNLSPADVIKRKRMFGVWFPYTLVDRLKGRLSELRGSEQYEALEQSLGSTLSSHFNQVQIDSTDVKSLVES